MLGPGGTRRSYGYQAAGCGCCGRSGRAWTIAAAGQPRHACHAAAGAGGGPTWPGPTWPRWSARWPCGWRGGLRWRRHTTSEVARLNGSKQPTHTTGPGGSSDPRQAALAFARCMRQHGTDLPDPQITADGIDQQPPTGVARDDPRLTAAQQACAQACQTAAFRPSSPAARKAVGAASEHAGDAHARARAGSGRARVLPGAARRAPTRCGARQDGPAS
jgi:hypothetical protein